MSKYIKSQRKEKKSLNFTKRMHGITPYIFLTIFGAIMWILTYICLYFYKEVFLCYIKSHIKFEEKSYLMKIKEYKSYLPRIFIFNLIIIVFWMITFFMKDEYRFYIIKGGFIFFVIIYIIFWSFYYKFNYNKTGFFDDFYIIFNFIKKEWFNENDNINDNDDTKEKKE